MLERHFRRERVRERIRSNPIGRQLTEFVEYLDRRGHSNLTIQLYVQAAEHYGRWLGESANFVNRGSVVDFVENHLPRCQCKTPAPRQLNTVRAALRHLLRSINSSTTEGSLADDRLAPLLMDYDEHLRRNAGLAKATRHYRLRYAREFLQDVSPAGKIAFESLTPQNVMDFVTAVASRCKRSSTQVAASSVRTFLRFLQFRGLCGERLVRSVPQIPQWKLSTVPETMREDQVACFLKSFDRSTATGRRDYAMALCMVEMGLRVSEVVRIEIADLDWRHAVLTIRAAKGRRVRQLPLSERMGNAVAEYLRTGRPESSCRNAFLRHTVPVGTAVTRELVRGVMRRAYARCGFNDWTGTHLLRHTAASRVHQRGATLKEVADLLGHRSIDTAKIYAKVNLPQLRAVALPWPEVQP